MRDQRIRDPIHNLIKFSGRNKLDEVLWNLVQTSPFQRLRRIKQLGFSEFVYPGASHSRFSHSLGAMQMGRRMLTALKRNEVFGNDLGFDIELWESATLCAALLHDIGHGPYSHVFESVSDKLGVTAHHEEYTLKLIEKPEISNILKASDHGEALLNATLSFFNTEPGEHAFSSIVSSQLDADRLDFLTRDRYFCGADYGKIDLEWVFDSLTIEQVNLDVDSDVTEYAFVVSNKGQSTIEEYLIAYFHMYSNIYFHKTTRGIEVLVREILNGVLADPSALDNSFADDPLCRYFKVPDEERLLYYEKLDDSSILSFIKKIAEGNFGNPTELAQRFIKRDLFACFEPNKNPHRGPAKRKIANFALALGEANISFFQDYAPKKGFKQFAGNGDEFLVNILVKDDEDGEPRPIGELNDAILKLADQAKVRFYFYSADQKTAAREIWNKL